MDILDFLRSDGSIVVNKKLAHEIGLNEAVIYSELVSLFKYWTSRDQLIEDKWFFCTSENLEKNTALKRKPQDRSIASLQRLGLIEVKKMGLPAKRYFAITNNIYSLFSDSPTKDVQNGQTDNDGIPKEENPVESRHDQFAQNGQTGMSEMDKLECPNWTTNNTRINNTELRTDDDENKETRA
ncbi:hypothetical protein ACFQU8_08690, partial [Lentibacillus kimchii]